MQLIYASGYLLVEWRATYLLCQPLPLNSNNRHLIVPTTTTFQLCQPLPTCKANSPRKICFVHIRNAICPHSEMLITNKWMSITKNKC